MDPYEVLGLQRGKTALDEKTLKQAYRQAALKWHPDTRFSLDFFGWSLSLFFFFLWMVMLCAQCCFRYDVGYLPTFWFRCQMLKVPCQDKVPEAQKKEAEERFLAISWAYEVLSDPQRRGAYDQPKRTDADGTEKARKPETPEDFDMDRAAKIFKDVFGDSSSEYYDLIQHLARSSASGTREEWKKHAKAIKKAMKEKGTSGTKSFSAAWLSY